MGIGRGPPALLVRLVGLAAIYAVALACVTAVPGGGGPGQGGGQRITDPTPVGPIAHQGRWLTDATGRVLMLRGINFVPKEASYYPSAFGFGAQDAVWLKEHGFDAVRLGLTGTGIMPTPGRIDEQFL